MISRSKFRVWRQRGLLGRLDSTQFHRLGTLREFQWCNSFADVFQDGWNLHDHQRFTVAAWKIKPPYCIQHRKVEYNRLKLTRTSTNHHSARLKFSNESNFQNWEIVAIWRGILLIKIKMMKVSSPEAHCTWISMNRHGNLTCNITRNMMQYEYNSSLRILVHLLDKKIGLNNTLSELVFGLIYLWFEP